MNIQSHCIWNCLIIDIEGVNAFLESGAWACELIFPIDRSETSCMKCYRSSKAWTHCFASIKEVFYAKNYDEFAWLMFLWFYDIVMQYSQIFSKSFQFKNTISPSICTNSIQRKAFNIVIYQSIIALSNSIWLRIIYN